MKQQLGFWEAAAAKKRAAKTHKALTVEKPAEKPRALKPRLANSHGDSLRDQIWFWIRSSEGKTIGDACKKFNLSAERFIAIRDGKGESP